MSSTVTLYSPIFAGGRLVYAERYPTVRTPFYLYDSALDAQGEAAELPPEALNNWRTSVTWKPIISFDGRYLVWTEEKDSATKMVAADTRAGAQLIAKQGTGFHASAVDGGRVVYLVWAPDANGQYSYTIRLWDIATDVDREIGPMPINPNFTIGGKPRAVITDPVIRGEIVAWITWDATAGYNLAIHDLRTGKTRTISTDGAPKENLLLGDRYALYQSIDQQGNDDRLLALPLHPLPAQVALTHPGKVGPVSFSDLGQDHWAFESIILVVAANLMQGDPIGTFRPNDTITRAEFLATLMRAYPKSGPLGDPFADIPDTHWAYTLIRQARGLGLVEGYQNQFEPDRPIGRGELAVMLQRFLHLAAPEDPISFPDVTADWMKPAIAALATNDILRGLPDGQFGPGRAAIRAEAATVLARLFQPK